MPATLPWTAILVRLALTVLAGSLIGLNRWERGRAAGLRTTLLVTLAAAIAMIQANLLLGTVGKASDSFIVMDLMRFPLGILSGMGFIGAGVILRRGRMVVGVTTAATLWFATVMGLCFGGGQLGTGLAALALGLIVLLGFRAVEDRLRRERVGTLTLTFNDVSPREHEISSYLSGLEFRVASLTLSRSPSTESRLRCEIRWRAKPAEGGVPPFISRLAERSEVANVEWAEAGPADN